MLRWMVRRLLLEAETPMNQSSWSMCLDEFESTWATLRHVVGLTLRPLRDDQSRASDVVGVDWQKLGFPGRSVV